LPATGLKSIDFSVRAPVFLLLLALLAGPAPAAEAGPAPAGLPATIGDVALANGRVLRSVVILSQTGLAINVRHAGGLTKIEKRLLPAELLARFPVNEDQAAREEQAAKEGLVRRVEHAQAASLWVVRAPGPRLPGVAAAGAATTPDQAAAAKAELAKRVASPAEQLSRSPKGLYITTWSNRSGGQITLEVANPTASAQKIEPRDLVALRLDNGQQVLGGDVRFDVKDRADPWVDAGQRRSFRVQFPSGGALAAVAWAGSGEWRVPGPYTEAAALGSEEEAMSLARANAEEARERAVMEANKARAARAIDKLDDRLIGK
jgi:hypothetical protein